MTPEDIQTLQRRLEKKMAGMTSNERKQHLGARRAKLASTLQTINKQLAELGCLGTEIVFEVRQPPQITRKRVYPDSNVEGFPQKLSLPKFPQLIDITDRRRR